MKMSSIIHHLKKKIIIGKHPSKPNKRKIKDSYVAVGEHILWHLHCTCTYEISIMVLRLKEPSEDRGWPKCETIILVGFRQRKMFTIWREEKQSYKIKWMNKKLFAHFALLVHLKLAISSVFAVKIIFYVKNALEREISSKEFMIGG